MAFPSRAQAKAQRSKRIPHTFSLNNILGDPFAISSLSIALISWIIAIAGSIAAGSSDNNFPRFTWWGIVYQFMLICIIILFYAYDLVDYYKSFLTGSLSVAFVYNTNSATNLVYSEGSKKAAASAGVILLSIVDLIWIFYFGGDNASPTNRWIDSFTLKGTKPSAVENARMRYRRRVSKTHPGVRNNRYESGITHNETQLHNYVSSTALTGFENKEPNHFDEQRYSAFGDQDLHHTIASPDANNVQTFLSESTAGNTETTMGDTLGLYSELGDSAFIYTAKALYPYDADENDQYEISFQQGEILKVSDIEGRWWKARKANGETGIIPSNYVELIESSSNSNIA